ncbi:hypothetical protein HETIRDRAFT_481526 [Heterobasidion irregulare TC 32-1]|uniref:Transaldolase n=1 Tax=Heterobasidion irregulare (strain TC 32-1) TaxID=747525 RepID=W4JQZ7_HETIT|nr:uncharacterized protein HETIRDRAFT_481526 [Heterobasidion irregulare TC 32-1]ETW75968.1 hypothetical protein HETIRDRAFT_481526 [Heterobasidion irregulare TC 32-1]
MATTLLAQTRTALVVDVDSMDPDVAARHTSATERFCDMTSNQAIVYSESIRPERLPLFKEAVQKARARGKVLNEQRIVDDAVDLFTVLLAKAVYPHLTGRVHAQTSPAAAYDTEETIAHAKRLVSVFEANGIPKERISIKIPTTPESIVACQYLEKIGIRTLATCLFSVSQALAASEAGCLYIAPYFNELRVHFEPGIWKEYKDTAAEHPMALVIADIVKTYKQIGSKTLIMPASIVTAAEVLALVSLHPDHLTLSGSVLDQLAALPAAEFPPSAPAAPPTESSSDPSTDYLASGGANLRAALAADAESTRKLADALKIFGEMEDKLKDLVRKELTTTT